VEFLENNPDAAACIEERRASREARFAELEARDPERVAAIKEGHANSPQRPDRFDRGGGFNRGDGFGERGNGQRRDGQPGN